MLSHILAIFSLGSVVLLYEKPMSLLLVTSAITLFWFSQLHDRFYVKVFFVSMTFGGLSELIAVHFGAWNYSVPQVAGLPLWLFVIWGCAGVYLVQMSELLRIQSKKQ